MTQFGNFFALILFLSALASHFAMASSTLIECQDFPAFLSAKEPIAQRQACCLCCAPESSLKLNHLCSDTIGANCLNADYITANDICTQSLSTQDLCTPIITTSEVCAIEVLAESLCANAIKTDALCALQAVIGQLCLKDLNIETLCVSSTLTRCDVFGIEAVLTQLVTYTLGDPLPFNSVISDPSNSLQQNPTSYTAPETGVYLVTIQVSHTNLSGGSMIVGTPTGLLEIYVNAVLERQTFTPFLTFNASQNTFQTTLISLIQGDVLTSVYKVLVLSALTGLTEYVGTVELQGTPLDQLRPFILIQHLSTNCSAIQCTPCNVSTCDLTTPCSVTCSPCQTEQCNVCC